MGKSIARSIGGKVGRQVGVPLATLLNSLPDGYAFSLPTENVTKAPVDTVTGWNLRRAGGTPAAALSVVDITDENDIARIGSNKAIRLNTGVTTFTTNQAVYALPASIDLTDKAICFWVRFVPGTGIYSFEKSISLVASLYTNYTADVRNYTLGTVNIEYASDGWYAFSFTPSQTNSTTAGSFLKSDIKRIGIGVNKALAADCPIIEIGMIAIVPKYPVAQLCFCCDGNYASHETIATLLTANGMNATFYVGNNAPALSNAQLKAMENNGHQIATYASNFGDNPSDTAATVAIITAEQARLTAAGFTAGIKSYVHGISSAVTEAQNKAIFPSIADNATYAMRTLTSPYHKTYISRFHEFNTANLTALTAVLNNAVADGARMGLLVHNLVGADLTAFETFVNDTLIPLKNAGTLEVITAKQAFNK